MSRRSTYTWTLMFVLALLNDGLDLLGMLSPVIELVLDIIIVIAIFLLRRKVDLWILIIALLDLIPGIDIAPIWTLYVLYLYLTEISRGAPRRVKVKVEVE